MFAWVDGRAVDVSRYALPIMRAGYAKGKKTQLEQLEAFYTALGAFSMTVSGDRCCVYRSSELCTLLNQTMSGKVATPAVMLKTITSEYVLLVTILEQLVRCKQRLTTVLFVLTRQSSYGKRLLRRIHPSASSLCAFSFIDYISESYRKALDRFHVYNEMIEHHIQDIKSIVEYMERPTHDPCNATIMFDAIVSMMDACVRQRTNIELLISTCRHQVSTDVIASQLNICNDHMCSSLELCANVHRRELVRCNECVVAVNDAEHCCTRCVFGLRHMFRSIHDELV